MTGRTLLTLTLALFLTSTVVMAAGLIWMAAADPQLLAATHTQHGWTGLALTVAGRALSVVW